MHKSPNSCSDQSAQCDLQHTRRCRQHHPSVGEIPSHEGHHAEPGHHPSDERPTQRAGGDHVLFQFPRPTEKQRTSGEKRQFIQDSILCWRASPDGYSDDAPARNRHRRCAAVATIHERRRFSKPRTHQSEWLGLLAGRGIERANDTQSRAEVLLPPPGQWAPVFSAVLPNKEAEGSTAGVPPGKLHESLFHQRFQSDGTGEGEYLVGEQISHSPTSSTWVSDTPYGIIRGRGGGRRIGLCEGSEGGEGETGELARHSKAIEHDAIKHEKPQSPGHKEKSCRVSCFQQ